MNVSLGLQIEFYYHWSQWMKTVDKPNRTESNSLQSMIADEIRSINPVSNDSDVVNVSLQYPNNGGDNNTQSNQVLKLVDILSHGPYGPGVMTHYKQHHSLNDKARKLLVEAFLQYCITTGITVTKADCKSLACEIANNFKGEIAVIFEILSHYVFHHARMLYVLCCCYPF